VPGPIGVVGEYGSVAVTVQPGPIVYPSYPVYPVYRPAPVIYPYPYSRSGYPVYESYRTYGYRRYRHY